MRGTKTGITGALAALAGALAGAFGVMKKAEKSINRSQNTADKNLGLFLMMEQWVMVKQEGKNLAYKKQQRVPDVGDLDRRLVSYDHELS